MMLKNKIITIIIMTEEYILNDTWVLWYHPINEQAWTKDTYEKIVEIQTIKEFYEMVNSFPSFLKGMFFFMRKGIFPQWEDEQNIKGGYFSYKINKQLAEEAWINCCKACIGESVTTKPEDMVDINGISYSPKISNCIIKILNANINKGKKDYLSVDIPHVHPNSSQYKPHMENAKEFVFE
jgi:hypothetical protein